MTVKAKAVIDAFYGARPTLSIWNGCSQGGRQGITEAVRYPADFDAHRRRRAGGELAAPPFGSPGHQSHRQRDAGERHPALEIPGHSPRRARGVRRARRRGRRRDRESRRLHLRPEGARSVRVQDDCVVSHAAAGRVRAGDVRRRIASGDAGDGAARPRARIGAGVERDRRPGADRIRRRGLQVRDRQGSGLGRRHASILASITTARRRSIPTTCWVRPIVNMRAFFARGGKLMLYHGWSDAQVTPYNTIDFFQKVVASQGGAGVGTSIQLYMVPGMNHCAGGPGTDLFDRMGGDRGVDQDRLGAEAHRGLARDRRSRRPHAAALSLRAGGALERHRQHERIGQLRLRRRHPGTPAVACFVRSRAYVGRLEVRHVGTPCRRSDFRRPEGDNDRWE